MVSGKERPLTTHHSPLTTHQPNHSLLLQSCHLFAVLVAAAGETNDPDLIRAPPPGFATVLPLVFLSGAWVPIATMQSGVQGFARHQPVNVTIDAVRSLAAGSPDHGAIVQSIIWSLGLLVVFVFLGVRQYQRA